MIHRSTYLEAGITPLLCLPTFGTVDEREAPDESQWARRSLADSGGLVVEVVQQGDSLCRLDALPGGSGDGFVNKRYGKCCIPQQEPERTRRQLLEVYLEALGREVADA